MERVQKSQGSGVCDMPRRNTNNTPDLLNTNFKDSGKQGEGNMLHKFT